MTKTVKRPHGEGGSTPDVPATDVDHDPPSELDDLKGASSLSQAPFPDDAHRADVERLGGEVNPEKGGPVAHERLVVQSDELRARAMEHELESGPTLDGERREETDDIAEDEHLVIRKK